MNLEHYKTLRHLIQEADQNGLLLKARSLTGFSGEKLIGTLQRLAQHQSRMGAGCYLEVGVFQGLTLISVASVLEGAIAYGIDNFAQFDPKKINQRIVNDSSTANNLNNIRLINADYETALEHLKEHIGDLTIGTYFIDGPHDYRSQLVCLNLAKPYLHELSVIVVDDCNYRHVRLANRDFLLANPDFKLLFEAYTDRHPANMDDNDEQAARRGWWNGVNIMAHDPNGLLGVMLPETLRDRQLYENEHIVHSAKYAALAPEAVSCIGSLMSLRLIRASKQLVDIGVRAQRIRRQHMGRYASMNTYSEHLPKTQFNMTLQ